MSSLKIDDSINAVAFLKPDPNVNNFTARGRDVIVILHMGKHLANLFTSEITEDLIDHAWRDFQFEQ
jgi:hypothetical protein